jgi:hypothetical protein
VHYIQNQPTKARDHFRGLREAKADLVGVTICDRGDYQLHSTSDLHEYMWRRRELENYLCQPETLLAYAEAHGEGDVPGPLFAGPESKRRHEFMHKCIEDNTPPAALHNPEHPWWSDTKASDEFSDPIFRDYLTQLRLPVSLMQKSTYHVLARFVPPERLSPEIGQVLDAILEQSQKARPVGRES